MTNFEVVLIFAGFAIAMLPLGIILGGNLMEEWQKQQEEEEQQ